MQEWQYAYNADGLRTMRTNGYSTYEYVYLNGQLVRMLVDGNTLSFHYDADGKPMSFVYNGTTYYYATNLQGDIVAILSKEGTQVVSYSYDAWGNILSITGTKADTIGKYNPLRYRGYVYDTESKLYYLQSRYYDPAIGRFINADSQLLIAQGLVGNNTFAYCLNNPVNYADQRGKNAEALQWWSAGMWWLCGTDALLPFGDIIYAGGVIILGAIALASGSDDSSEATLGESFSVNNSPSPNNSDDDDDDDDYYYDDGNFGGRQKVGKRKGNTPGNNQKQNKQFRDATRGLTKAQQRILHDRISKKGLGFHEIEEIKKNLFIFSISLFAPDDER